MLNGLDLFSGIGGLTKALRSWVAPVVYCEKEKYAQAVLLQKISDGDLPNAPIWDDVNTLKGEMLPKIDIIYGGFPCQDISTAGNGAGLEGKRSGLFFEVVRLLKETKAPWLFLENVPAIRTRGLKDVIGALTYMGYDCRWTCVSAAEVGAPHIRKRWFLLAHAKRSEGWEQPGRRSREGREKKTDVVDNFWQSTKPTDNRICDGIPGSVDRVKALGNAVVPIQATVAFERLLNVK